MADIAVYECARCRKTSEHEYGLYGKKCPHCGSRRLLFVRGK